jgi:hypothetical protein
VVRGIMIKDYRIEAKMTMEGKDVVMPASMLPVVPAIAAGGEADVMSCLGRHLSRLDDWSISTPQALTEHSESKRRVRAEQFQI